LTLALVGTTLIEAILPALSAWVGKLVVDEVVHAITTPPHALSSLVPVILIALLFAVMGQAFRSLSQIIIDLLRDMLGFRINALVIEKAVSLDMSYYDTPLFYDMLQRAQQEASYRPLAMVQQVFSLFRQSIALFSFAILLFRFSPWVVVIVALTSLPALYVQSKHGRTVYRMYSGRAPEWRNLMYLGLLLTAKRYVKEIKLFGLAPTLVARYKNLHKKFQAENRDLSIKRNISNVLLQLFSLLGYYSTYFWIIVQTIAGSITIGDLTMYSAVLIQAQSTAGSLMGDLASLYEQNLFIGNLFQFLALEPKMPVDGKGQTAPTSIQYGFEIHGVSFKYPGRDKWVLRGVDLKILPGEKIALVGKNGAGKTTLIKLLTRLYDPIEGEIQLDGVDLKDISPESLHNRVGVIFQDYARYDFTGRENIGFGDVENMEDLNRIVAAAKKSGAHRVLSELPEGYDTKLGRRFDKTGSDLSVGEWQKIALARAYMRRAPIIILDEPTSALDAEAEYEVYKQFRRLSEDKMLILVSHRFSTVRMVDRIIVLDNGQIVEQGTHKELLAANGLYASMFNMQAEGYI
jgi:ATP-binding cassette subfamily B protein